MISRNRARRPSLVALALGLSLFALGSQFALGPAAPAVASETTAATEATAITQASVPLTGEIPVDAAVRRGQLDNGLRYLIRENGKPSYRAELRLVVEAGSIDEDEDQRGLAHFLEHMLFNGTASFPGNEIVDFLESIGARFGADLNAYTSFDETVYMLEVPTDREGLLEQGIHVLGEFAAKATIEDEEVERERGVVLDEWRGRLGARQRIREQQWPIVLKGSRYAERLPIGDPEIIEHGEADAIRRYYRDWYRPERMAVVAVGDFDADTVEAEIRARFGEIPASESLRERHFHDVPAQADTLFALAEDDELRGTRIGFSLKRPAPEEAATWEAYGDGLVESLAISMFGDRLDQVSKREDPPFLGAALGRSNMGPQTEIVSAGARVADGGEEAGLAALLRETRRVREFGFLESELERAKTNYLAGLEAAAAEKDKTPSGRFVGEYVRHVLRSEPIPGIEAELAYSRGKLPEITVAECDAAFRALTDPSGFVVEASRPAGDDLVGEDELRAVLGAVAAETLAPWTEKSLDVPLVANRRPAGRVIERNEITEIGVTELKFSNGVTAYLKPTEFEDDTIIFHGLTPGGISMAGDDELASAEMASALVAEAGWGGHSRIDLRRLVAGKVASAAPYFSSRWHGISGSSTVADLPTALDLAVLVMTAPNRDPAAFDRVLERVRVSLANRDADPGTRYGDRLTEINNRNHPRTRPFTLDRLGEIDPDEALAFYARCFENPSDFAFFFVGNLDVDLVQPELERTLGSLADAGSEPTAWVDREVLFAAESVRETVFAGREPKSQTSITMHSYGGDDPFEWHRLRTATSILQRRLRDSLREDLGGTYGVGASYSWSLLGPARGTVSIRFGSDPADAERLAEQALEVLRELREEGPTEEEMAKERELQTRDLETSWERNAFWLANFYGLWIRERPLTEILDRQDRIDALDRGEIARVLREHFDLERMTWVDWKPAAVGAEAEPDQS